MDQERWTMRFLVLLLMILTLSIQAVAAENVIPQDLTKMQKRRREWLEWNLRTSVDAYDKVGRKDPRWDAQARRAMELASRMFSRQVEPTITFTEVYAAAKAAVDAGCDDPYIAYLYTRSAVGEDAPPAREAARRSQAAADSMAKSRYPAFRRASALDHAGTTAPSGKGLNSEARKQAERDFDAILALIPESVASDEHNEFWEALWLDKCKSVIKGYRTLGVSPAVALERVEAKLAKSPELQVLRLVVRGDFHFFYGWEIRSKAFASQVGARNMRTFESEIAEAQKAFKEAWRLRPDDGPIAGYMLEIEKAIGGGDRAAMELWFERSMKANGDAFDTCLAKLDWLDPKWYGTPDEMVAFGRACLATKNWQSAITLLVGDAHLRYGSLMEHAEKTKYLASREVWPEISSAYSEFLKHCPNSHLWRSKYAALCYMSNHLAEAHEQFQILGDNLTTWPIFPFVPLPELKRIRDHAKQVVEGQKGKAKDAA
jgi:hypothetical protein